MAWKGQGSIHTTADHPGILKLATGKGVLGGNAPQEKEEIEMQAGESNSRLRTLCRVECMDGTLEFYPVSTTECYPLLCVPGSVLRDQATV